MADFNKAFQLILAHEGGYINDSDDPGGETYKGIARKMNPDWLGWHIIDLLKKQPGFPESLCTCHEVEINCQLQYEVKSFYYLNFHKKIPDEKLTLNE